MLVACSYYIHKCLITDYINLFLLTCGSMPIEIVTSITLKWYLKILN